MVMSPFEHLTDIGPHYRIELRVFAAFFLRLTPKLIREVFRFVIRRGDGLLVFNLLTGIVSANRYSEDDRLLRPGGSIRDNFQYLLHFDLGRSVTPRSQAR